MERPQARIIDHQHVESEREVTGWEAEQLLRKYGYTEPQQYSTRQNDEKQPSEPGLTFEEMLAQEELNHLKSNIVLMMIVVLASKLKYQLI